LVSPHPTRSALVYGRKPLEEELLRIFGQTTFGESKTRLIIPTFEGRHGEPWIYKTPHHPDYKRDRHERMVHVGLSTSAAPTYFEALSNGGYVMVDGGLWANNPVMNAVVNALACYDIERRQIQVMSLGCGETSFKVDEKLARGGLISWRKVIKAAMRAQSLNALGQAYLLVGKNQVTRLDAPETPTPIGLDDFARAREELPFMAPSLVEGSGREIERGLFPGARSTVRAVPNRCDPVWFGVMVTIQIEIAAITPPVGFNLFVLKSVVPGVEMVDVVRGSLIFIIPLLLGIVLLMIFP
jgi:uncharacterized protein